MASKQPQEFRYIPCNEFWSEPEADALFEFAKCLPRVRQDAVYQSKVVGKKRIIGLGSYSISPNKRGLRNGVENPQAQDIANAPEIVRKLAKRLTKFNGGKSVNYLSFIAYENEGDHIDWHQHNEDRCRDATVYIVSLGEVRTFGLRRVCEKHQICDKCHEVCHADRKTLCKDCKDKRRQQRGCPASCKLKHTPHYKPCPDCDTRPSKWKSIQPEHGSVIVLPDSYNRTHEHAILGKQDKGGDKRPKGLRISINTKNIRRKDFLYVERENRSSMNHGEDGLIPLFDKAVRFPTFQAGVLRKASGKPRVWCCRKGNKYPRDAVYVGCLTERFPGTIYGNDYKPFKGHKNWIATTNAGFRKYAKKKMQDPTFRSQAIKELRGKDLLCWCPQDKNRDSSYKQPFCHARVWLDVVNRPEYGQ